MSASSAEPPSFAAPPARDAGWSRRKWVAILTAAVAAHLALVFLFDTGRSSAPRPPVNVPQFHLAAGNPELLALMDPTLFALPHESVDFVPSAWRVSPPVDGSDFSWSEPAPSLLLATNTLGSLFGDFLQTNELSKLKLDFKPQPRFTVPVTIEELFLPRHSTVRISGDLARRLVEMPAAPVLPGGDILKPGRVQVLVDESGSVTSTVLLESSENETADRKALEIARATRFQPARGTVFGEMTFNWHTVPTNAP